MVSDSNVISSAPSLSLTGALKKYFGYAAFRPLQREIIEEIMADRSVFALLPTGGGKSLCYQLPAILREGLTIVVSPLIALMKDQVDQLTANGVPATFLNSSLTPQESSQRQLNLKQGKYHLLFVAPERLRLGDFVKGLKELKINLIAIDEAHCISEWGHDFRPEYRQLSSFIKEFPGVPVLALTATATDRVRADIIRQLNLNTAKTFVASFNRPNLTYTVVPKNKPKDYILAYISEHKTDAGIVYCQSRDSTEALADYLQTYGVNAQPYHAGMPPAQRTKNQDLFLKDDVNVICATIAFGMGINKSNIRFVIHHDLPKNVEGYYQETGRAGRDGLPSDCILLYRPGDAYKQIRFIENKPTESEQKVARQQLDAMMRYSELAACRRKYLIRYFGEDWKENNCSGCDNCLTPRQQFDGTLAAQKLLSCVYRIREKSGFGVGLNHVVAVLTGSKRAQIKKWGHDTLSTFGIGQEFQAREWQIIGEELTRQKYLEISSPPYNILNLTPEGFQVLKERHPVSLTKPLMIQSKSLSKPASAQFNSNLFDALRSLRKRLADEKSVPAYIIFSDATLKEMARVRPSTKTEFSRITGVGAKKLEEFSDIFLKEIATFLKKGEEGDHSEM